MKATNNKAIIFGLIAAFFFAITFILNRQMSLTGGHWLWTTSLRFIIMFPILLVIVLIRGNFGPLWLAMKQQWGAWLLWSTIGFGVFYAPLTFAAKYGPAWLIASTWEITIIAGMLMAPLLESKQNRKPISGKMLFFSCIILAGVALMQLNQEGTVTLTALLWSIIPVTIAAFAFPLGNRMMMKMTQGKLDAFQRTLGMTMASLPFFIALSIAAFFTAGWPSGQQILQSTVVAIGAGVIGIALFFKATDMAKGNQQLLASVEATQAAEVVFALIGEMIFLHSNMPGWIAITGILLVLIGMILHSRSSH